MAFVGEISEDDDETFRDLFALEPTPGEGLLFRFDAGVMARVELALGEKGAVLDGRLLVSMK